MSLPSRAAQARSAPRGLMLALLALVFACAGCRTQIAPFNRPEPKLVYVGDKSCTVYDFVAATDLPAGARNLGWFSVKKAENDEETYIKLREMICEMGGDALSQVAWIRELDQTEPSTLSANAWSLP
jgi:hypothetical protein